MIELEELKSVIRWLFTGPEALHIDEHGYLKYKDVFVMALRDDDVRTIRKVLDDAEAS